uniref:Phosphoribosylamine--glycine ligase n=1 Tax=candidate division WOR-3 bacterium TaxID=2052148 RepID=A0A7C4U8A3_UNCW3
MKILIIGSGGREHAIGWKIKQEFPDSELFFSPGNGGTIKIGKNIQDEPLNFAKKNKIDLTIVGPEDPLIKGIVDEFKKEGLKIFGPDRKSAMLEGDKGFAKDFMRKYNIPTANYEVFDDYNSAKRFLEKLNLPIVIKASGPAAGKGTFIVYEKEIGFSLLEEIMVNKIFGKSGEKIVIEDFLEGEEVSIIGFYSNHKFLPLLPAQDYKKLLDDDKGPNTGGMGSYSPVPFVNKRLFDEIKKVVIDKVIEGNIKEGIDYNGILYIGIILTDSGPKVLEFNARFGDPETQAILPLIKNNFLENILRVSNGDEPVNLEYHNLYSLCVVLCSEGYPKSYKKGIKIEFNDEPLLFFHAGTIYKDGDLLTNGGRVLNIIGLGETLLEASIKAYNEIKKVHFDGMYYRKDIGSKHIKKEVL